MDLQPYLKFLPIERFKNPPPRVAVIGLAGAIGSLGPLRSGLTLASLEKTIERAFALPRLSAVALAINSPGGSPVQSELIAARIRQLAAEKDVPVFAFCEDVAASGGYWLACAGDEIFVQEASILGSIGVISAGFGFHHLIERYGIERRVYAAGERKSTLDPFKPENPEDIAHLEDLQRDVHEAFKGMVRRRRGERLKGAETELFSGEFWSGTKALELGLADSLGELRQVLRDRFGDKVEIKRIDGEKPWLRRRFGLAGLEAMGPQDWAGSLLAAAEERALWARFGL